MPRSALSAAALALALAGLPGPAAAEVKEYQIRRMLMLRTTCTVVGLEISAVADDVRYRDRFRAACENVSHYPDGVEILCPETEDERDCRLLTAERTFPHLDLLRP